MSSLPKLVHSALAVGQTGTRDRSTQPREYPIMVPLWSRVKLATQTYWRENGRHQLGLNALNPDKRIWRCWRERESEFCNLVFREEIRLISSEINIRSRQQGMAEHGPQGRVWQSDSPFFAIIYRFQLSATRRLKQIALDFSEWLKILWTTMLMKY